MIGFLIAAVLSSQPVLIGREPRAASPWVQSVTARCGHSAIEISGYGAARPVDRQARILINRHEIQGRQRGQLLADLARRPGAYRIEILCGLQEVTIRIHVGQREPGKAVRFWSGAAFIKGNTIVSYTGLQEADESSFWFR